MIERRNPSRMRLVALLILGIVITAMLNMFVWTGRANAAPTPPYPDYCNDADGWGWVNPIDCGPLGHEINTSRDLRQAAGNAATACAAGWWFGGALGCKAGAAGAVLGSIPWDGTWD